jgi:hypothetical protein
VLRGRHCCSGAVQAIYSLILHLNREYQKMTTPFGSFLATLLGSLSAVTAIKRTEAQAVPAQPPKRREARTSQTDKDKDKEKDNKNEDRSGAGEAAGEAAAGELQAAGEELSAETGAGAAAAQAEARFRAGTAGTDPEAATAVGRPQEEHRAARETGGGER